MTKIIIRGNRVVDVNAVDAPLGWKCGYNTYQENLGFSVEEVDLPADFNTDKYLWVNGGLEIDPEYTPVSIQEVPQQATMRQACLALENAGLLDDVEALVATLPRLYQIEWERASTVERSNQLVEVVRQQQGMTEQQIDELFILARSL